MIKKCVICGKEFETNKSQVICCSADCKGQRKREMNKKYRQENIGHILEYQRKRNAAKSKHARGKNTFNGFVICAEDGIDYKAINPQVDYWIDRYNSSDAIGKMAMVGKANGYDYGWAQAMKYTQPEKYEQLVKDTVKRMSKEVIK